MSHELGWGAVAQAEPGAVVELGGDALELVVRVAVEVGALGQVLAQQPVGVLVAAALPIYTAVNAAAARAALDDLAEKWGQRYGAVIRLWENAWNEFIPFLDYDIEIRKVICSTNAIESLNARYRRAIKARGHFPSEQATLKCLYLVARSLDPTGTSRTRWDMRWKPALNAFAVTFGDRFPAAETY